MYDDVGKKLGKLRREARLSQKELARALNELGEPVTDKAVSKWEKGATIPSVRQFLLVCRVLKVTDISGEFMGAGPARGLDPVGRQKLMEYADLLRRSRKPVVLCVNKVDTGEKMFDAYQFYGLGLGELYAVSAANGSGTGDLLDAVVKALPEEIVTEDPYAGIPRVAIVGKPNVGKSSLTNALLGEERNIVTPVAGTTRDSIETHYNKFGHEFMLVDTAGIRKKGKVYEDLEFYSVMRSIRAIEHSDVCVMMIDATTGMEAQDMNIFNLIIRNRKGCVLVVNKWDLFIKDSSTMKEYTKSLKSRLQPFDDVPVIFTSVLKMQRIQDVLDAVTAVSENYSRRIPTARLNEAMLPVIEETPPPSWKGKFVKIKYITQLPTKFPAFAFFCNLPQYVKEPYRRFLENQLRERFPLTGCPIQIYFRQK